MIRRYAFHRGQRGSSFLPERLDGARSYDRIAGYFDSSLLEFAGEAFESVKGRIRIVCNSRLKPADVLEAARAEQEQRLSFLRHDPAALAESSRDRLRRLYRLLASEQLEVRVLPDESFGMIHGKAGVIVLADGRRTSFLGSTNETWAGWNLNYELVWEDDSEEACDWIQQEFERLWQHPNAVPLSRSVVQEVERVIGRSELDLSSWRQKNEPAGTVVEAPVYREQFGLWPHQRYFVELAWRAHQAAGARFVLADQVGLGKTVQLAMIAQMAALTGSSPVLILLPKTLMEQWQTELWDLMEIPSARWTGRAWVDESLIEHPPAGSGPLGRCPRRIGIVSQGLVVRNEEVAASLLSRDWELVVVDEAHHARRRKLPRLDESGTPIRNPQSETNKLYAFLFRLAPRTRSLLLSTATPIQLHPIEAWDLLRLLSEGNDHVLGSPGSKWRQPDEALPYLRGQVDPPDDNDLLWDWLKNPLPPRWEGPNFRYFRDQLGMDDSEAVAVDSARIFGDLPRALQTRMRHAAEDLFDRHHPFLRNIVRRTRGYLEEQIDPTTNQPYLRKIAVELFDDDPIHLESYLADGYRDAERFCRLLAKRVKSAGFFKTLLLRRIGSSIKAGLSTVEMMLHSWDVDLDQDGEEGDDLEAADAALSDSNREELKNLTRDETRLLEQCGDHLRLGLEQRRGADPKYEVIIDFLRTKGWAAEGCILFSQYHDTARWVGERLAEEFPEETVALYAGAAKSGVWEGGMFLARDREKIKQLVRERKVKILVGTDAASEGLNLQTLGTLINIDLPWNPTRLEQRKGRIQRIGQYHDTIKILNLRYKDSVEARVHEVLSDRLRAISDLFGQIPDVLKDVWVEIALDNLAAAQRLIEDVPNTNPFDERYSVLRDVPEWDTWKEVLNKTEKLAELRKPW